MMVQADAIVAMMDQAAHPDSEHRIERSPDRKYLSFVCHDLNNNLNAIAIHLELLRQRLLLSNDFVEESCMLEQLRGSISRTTTGMRRMLARERFRKQHPRAQARRVNLHMLAADVRAQHYLQARAKGLEISVDVPRDSFMHSDASLIAIVLQNLVGNSVKFSDRGTIRIGARHDPEPLNGGWDLSVSDQGPGIAPEYIDNIFDAFERGDTAGREGVGLGLAIASEAARLLDATLSAETQAGVSSTFHLKLKARLPKMGQAHLWAAERRRVDVRTNR
jgi:signal transduction histidine kinase